jgi:glycosyltransferase involved in cell wall biosynthesis
VRICYLSADRGISLGKCNGSATHVRSLVGAFASLGHDVTLVMPSHDGWEHAGVRKVSIPTLAICESGALRRRKSRATSDEATDPRRLISALRHIWHNGAVEQALETVLAENRPDVIYERYSPFGVAGSIIARSAGIPHILEVNAPLAWEGKTYRAQALPEAAEALEQATFDNASVIIAVSRELRETLRADGVKGKKIQVVPNGVDTRLFAPEGPSHRNGFGDKTVIGFVGSLKAWHGIDVLAEAFARLADDRRFHLLIVGDGPMAPTIEALAEARPETVTFIRGVPHGEVPAYIRAMDVAVAPYPTLDQFYFSPLKVLEYMAAGRPVVASRIGQLDQLIRDGETGILVPPGDASALVEAIGRLADDGELSRGIGARAAAETQRDHTWMQRASQIVDLAESTAAGDKG